MLNKLINDCIKDIDVLKDHISGTQQGRFDMMWMMDICEDCKWDLSRLKDNEEVIEDESAAY